MITNQQLKEKHIKLKNKQARLGKKFAKYMKSIEELMPNRDTKQEEYDKVWALLTDLTQNKVIPLEAELVELENLIVIRFFNVE